jgi:predicted DNA-binding transcriptional regulator AlpA
MTDSIKLAQRLKHLASESGAILSEDTKTLLLDAATALEGRSHARNPAVQVPKRVNTGLRDGEEIIWARGVRERYGISSPTLWRWEKSGRLPRRDVSVGAPGKTRVGWRRVTLEMWESRQ